MPFNDPITYADGNRLTKNQLAVALRDNMEALKFPPTASYLAKGRLTDYSTTSPSFTDIDGINMALSIMTTGDGNGGNGDVFLCLNGTLYSSGASRIYIRFLEDGNVLNADDGLLVSDNTGVRALCAQFFRFGATAGNHTYKCQWKVNTGTAVLLAGAGTSTRDCPALFWVREMT